MKKNKKKLICFLILIICLIIWGVPNIVILFVKNDNDSTLEKKNRDIYNIFDMYKLLSKNVNENSYVEILDNVIYEKNLQINTNIKDLEQNSYYFELYLGQQEEKCYNISNKNEIFNIPIELDTEGENNVTIKLYKNNELIQEKEQKIYYIEKYKKQFLDELTSVCIGVRPQYMGDLTKTINLLKSCGINQVRVDALLTSIYKDGIANITNTDNWVGQFSDNGIEIELILNTDKKSNLFGIDGKISSEEEKDEILRMIEDMINRYPQISKYEFLNEPNFYYNTEEDMYWYAKVVEEIYNLLKAKDKDSKLIVGSTAIIENGEINSIPFLEGITKYSTYKNSNSYSMHFYDFSDSGNNDILKNRISPHVEFVRNIGGFQKINISEYGIPTIEKIADNTKQAEKLVQQSNILKEYNIQDSSIYTLINPGEDTNSQEDNYGIVNYDYTPKPAYYSLKNYYENTNGSEYIGTINLADGLEAHVYDKEGKPKIITWSDTKDQTIQIDYANFTAKDLYGNDIENTNGKLDITTSPVYIDNISTKYFYEAISNTALEKYSEFEEKFATEISSVEGLQENIDTLKQYLESISNIENESEETAKQKMKEHFNLGNQILTAYKDKALDVEYVKLSSMLDMLNEIGDSFEDLVTVTAKTRNPDLENTKTLIDNAEQAINNNNDLDIVYPEKILEFSKDLYEDSEYINNLEEENDIKTGLIVSYDLHAKYLADWANTFANIYIDEYIENNPVTESYSATSLTNQDVTVTLNIPQDVKITNNEGNNTYTFTENGTFTFEYERRGKTDSKLVSVNYIDKTPPEITNVENGEVYTQSITPNASDEHLDKVQLTFKGQVIEDYEVGDELAEEGEYKLTATDIVGNTSTVKFYIMKEDSTYKIKESNILNISPDTKIKDFKDKFTVMEGYTIKHENTELTEEDAISTGDILEETDGNKFTLIVKGDLNCDGRLSIVDLSIERKYLLGIIEIDEVKKLSSDMNIDEETSLVDLSIMRKTILGIIEL